MKVIASYLRLPDDRRRLLTEAAIYLLGARIQTALLPFRRIAPTLGTASTESPAALPAAQQALTRDIAWAVNRAAHHLPAKLLCLQQAIAAKHMLARRKIPGTLYLGTRYDDHGELLAHAWLRSGTIRVTGGDGSINHAVMDQYS